MGFGEENGQKLHAGKHTRLLAILHLLAQIGWTRFHIS